ncbi:MAG TPA: hypothetical protein VM345_04200 [Acidimicrobiales bacterium]|jgi:hypothetical protein|nr:hypothetical protein [Acidimicrobiales bacterium]
MTRPAPHLDDDALNAIIDGEPAGENAGAHVDGCASCAARLDALRAAAAFVATPVAPLSAAISDDLIAGALAALDGRADVVPIDASRRRQRMWMSPRVLSAVAAVAAVLLGVPALLTLSGRSGDDSGSQAMVPRTESFDEESTATAGGGVDATAAGRSGAGGGTADTESHAVIAAPASGSLTATSGEPNLGPIDTDDDLVRRLVSELSSGGQRGSEGASLCENEARNVGGDRISSRVFVGSLTWRGEPARVFVFQLTEPAEGVSRQAYVLRANGCAVLAEPRF